MKTYNLHSPLIDKQTFRNVNNCLKSVWLSPSGNYVRNFENKINQFTNSSCVACNSGTSALHICLILSGVESQDEVIVPTVTYIATINSVLYTKASPLFMDCDNKLSIDLEKLEEFLKKKTVLKKGYCINRKTKKKIKALIITHVFGDICDFKKLKKICKKYKIKIIEDAAEAFGSFYKKKYHAGTLGDFGALSFNFNKIITSGGGGAVLFKNRMYESKIRKLISHAKIDNIYFKHEGTGYNYGLPNISAAIGFSQLKKVKKIIKEKLQIHKWYRSFFDNQEKIQLIEPKSNYSNHWLNSIVLKDCSYPRFKAIITKLNKKGVHVRPLWYPCHLQKYLKKYQTYKIDYSSKIYKKLICLPSSYFLKKKDIKKITTIILNASKF